MGQAMRMTSVFMATPTWVGTGLLIRRRRQITAAHICRVSRERPYWALSIRMRDRRLWQSWIKGGFWPLAFQLLEWVGKQRRRYFGPSTQVSLVNPGRAKKVASSRHNLIGMDERGLIDVPPLAAVERGCFRACWERLPAPQREGRPRRSARSRRENGRCS